MDSWIQRLFITLALAVVVLLGAFAALAAGMAWLPVMVMGLALFSALIVVQLFVEMRRDVRLLKTQALELSGYESEIGRRVDYLASLVERSGGAAPDEIAKRVRAINHQYAALADRIARLEEDVAETAITGGVRQGAAAAGPSKSSKAELPAAKAAAPGARTVPPMRQPKPSAPTEKKTGDLASASVIPIQRQEPSQPPGSGRTVSERKPVATQPDADAAQAFRRALSGERLAFHLMPIVALPERTPIFYEAVMRLRGEEGGWTEHVELMDEAERHGLSAIIERKTLYTAARMLRSVRRMGKEMKLIAPLSASSLADERGFEELRAFLKAAPDLRDSLRLEIPQRRFRAMAAEARQRIGEVADAGFALSLGSLRDTTSDPQTLNRLGFTTVRAPASLLIEGPDAGTGPTLAVTLASHRIDLVATGVDDESTLAQLVEHDVMSAQGTALSAPRLVKPDLLDAAPIDAPAAPPIPRAAAS